MKTPSLIRPGTAVSMIWKKVNEVLAFAKSIVPKAGRGLTAVQTAGGVSLSVKKHGKSHADGGDDEIKFTDLEAETLTLSDGGDPEHTIALDPSAADFLAGRLLAVNDAGTASAWRTLLDLVDGLSGYAGGYQLAVNSSGDGLEWVAPSTGAGDVKEDSGNPIENGKLVIGTATAKELAGTLIGINTHGSAYNGYDDDMIPTDARAAAISDSRFAANLGVSANTFQADNRLCFWDDAALRIIGGITLKDQIASEFNFAALVGGYWLMVYDDDTGLQVAKTIYEVLA
ncbi:MAG TPA: hypothetical protein VJ904_01185, partial [Tichowtungia sp.]|nr:hypothetical protein [Tichowtungia sp.]